METVCFNLNCEWNRILCSTGQRFVKVITAPTSGVELSLTVNSANVRYEERLIERFLIKKREGVTVGHLCDTCYKLYNLEHVMDKLDKIKQKKTEKIFVFQLKDGSFYKMHRKGAWSYDPISKKDISCKFIDQADKFTEDHSKQYATQYATPYLHKALEGGRWVEIKVTTLYEESK